MTMLAEVGSLVGLCLYNSLNQTSSEGNEPSD
jgi:hypothetical protein